MSKKRYPGMLDLCQLAQQVRSALIHGYTSRQYKIEVKSDKSKVTDTDKEVNGLVIQWMKTHFPSVTVIGEEGNGNEHNWRVSPNSIFSAIIDPIDGTEPFTLGLSSWTFCVAILKGHHPITAIIYDVLGSRVWFAEKGKGSFLNDKPLHIIRAPLEDSTVATLWGHNDIGNLDKVSRRITDLGAKCTNFWAPAIGGGLVASSHATASLFGYTSVWETAAMKLIVEEAGGRATDLWGKELEFKLYWEHGDVQLAPIAGHVISNGYIHDELLELIAQANKAQPLEEVGTSQGP